MGGWRATSEGFYGHLYSHYRRRIKFSSDWDDLERWGVWILASLDICLHVDSVFALSHGRHKVGWLKSFEQPVRAEQSFALKCVSTIQNRRATVPKRLSRPCDPHNPASIFFVAFLLADEATFDTFHVPKRVSLHLKTLAASWAHLGPQTTRRCHDSSSVPPGGRGWSDALLPGRDLRVLDLNGHQGTPSRQLGKHSPVALHRVSCNCLIHWCRILHDRWMEYSRCFWVKVLGEGPVTSERRHQTHRGLDDFVSVELDFHPTLNLPVETFLARKEASVALGGVPAKITCSVPPTIVHHCV